MTCGMTFMARDTGCQIRDARYVARDKWHETCGASCVQARKVEGLATHEI
jgi:hypothetical protein